MSKKNHIPNFHAIGVKLVKDTARYASVKGLNFFKDSFHKQGWTDINFEPWDKRQQPDTRPGGAVLTQTGNLRDSLQVLHRSATRIVFGTHAPYAQVHNEGGTLSVPVTQRSRRFFWFMYRLTENPKWKWMALTKKTTLTITLPKRQFIGESQTLRRGMDQWVVKQILNRFKHNVNTL